MNLSRRVSLICVRFTDADEHDERSNTRILDFLARVRSSQLAVKRRAQRPALSLAQVVRERQFFQRTERVDFAALMAMILPAPKRSLRPQAKPRQASTAQFEQCKLLIQLVGARNIPVRSQLEAGTSIAEGRRSRHSATKKRETAVCTITTGLHPWHCLTT